jgi:single-strand DNA-binding protein
MPNAASKPSQARRNFVRGVAMHHQKEKSMSYRSINRVVLVGRLTRDPELRELPSGQSVCDLRVACNGNRRDADGGYSQRPNYFDVSAFGSQAESIARYLRRGSPLAIDGRLEWREWESAEQVKRQAVKVIAESVQFLDRRAGESRESSAGEDTDGSAPSEQLAGEDAAEGEIELVF